MAIGKQDHIHKYLCLLHGFLTQEARKETRTDGYKIKLSKFNPEVKIVFENPFLLKKQEFTQLNHTVLRWSLFT